MNDMAKKGVAEFLGTYWLVLGGCGSAVLAAAFPEVGIGLLGVAGIRPDGGDHGLCHWPYLGCHLNPAVTVGLWAGGRFHAKDMPLYIIAQVLARLPPPTRFTSSPAASRASCSNRTGWP